jgi:hypothetical protein
VNTHRGFILSYHWGVHIHPGPPRPSPLGLGGVGVEFPLGLPGPSSCSLGVVMGAACCAIAGLLQVEKGPPLGPLGGWDVVSGDVSGRNAGW